MLSVTDHRCDVTASTRIITCQQLLQSASLTVAETEVATGY